MPAQPVFFQREGFVIVGLIWVVTCLFGSLPFWFSGCFASFVDCLFEASSGFTTTGATILPDIEALPQGIQFWRCFTHWLGGMGVLVLATAVFPSLGARSQYLTRAETPGPMVVKLVPKQAKTSKILYGIYCAMTLAVIALLWGAGMPLYDAAVHAFSIAGTGGFSSRNASFAAYPLPGVDLIVATATLLFSLNFGLFFLALRRRFREIWRSEELRFFLAVVALATVLIAWDLDPVYHQGALESLRYAFFHVTSVISTSGFFTEDYALWPQFSQVVLVLLMLGALFVFRRRLTDSALLSAGVVLALGVPFLLPYMHDRYFFLADVLTLVWACAMPRNLLAPALAQLASLSAYLVYFRQRYTFVLQLGGKTYTMLVESLLILAALAYACCALWLELRQTGKGKNQTVPQP